MTRRKTSSLAIAKERVSLELIFGGGHAVRGDVFVLPFVGLRVGRERLVDLLVGPEPFFPVEVDGEVVLLRRDRVALVRVANPEDADIPEAEGAIEIEVTAVLGAGLSPEQGRIRGKVRFASRPFGDRLLDLLNEPDAFLPVIVDDGAVLIAKRYLQSVKEQEPGDEQSAPQ